MDVEVVAVGHRNDALAGRGIHRVHVGGREGRVLGQGRLREGKPGSAHLLVRETIAGRLARTMLVRFASSGACCWGV